MKVLVTGGVGYVGRSLIKALAFAGHSVVSILRQHSSDLPPKVEQIAGDLRELSIDSADSLFQCKLEQSLQMTPVVIHLAARVHVMSNDDASSLAEFRSINVQATLRLAQQAARAGAKRFIFLSSIKVNGESTSRGMAFRAGDTHIPTDHYGLSKYEAEQGLLTIAAETGMEVVIIRPPLVYGPGVRANFASMIRWMQRGIPLPFGAIDNRRSFIALDNLVSFIIHCIDHPKAANEIFLISDGEDVSTTVLLQKMSKALGKKSCLMPVPERWLRSVAKILGREDEAGKVLNSLQVDSSKARDVLGWKPVIRMDEQLHKTAEWYLSEKNL
ncbi:MAG: UDP-glucose 4-epimerase [Cycloclasticus sp.]|nr:UDP-glucose 4-epimerase [Cycloclasticus sp.]MBG96145.1 UDP-glucose 4-epimerase [Cycloclasticus sp.]